MPFTKDAPHQASGTIRRAASSKTMCNQDVVDLYDNLKKLLGHFSQSPRSTEFLNEALNALNQYDVHMLVWGNTRMSGFLDGCSQASGIIVPFIDTLVSGKIRVDETAYITSPKG